ncbi:MAG: Eco57I restriction-modification methylase domain-containing protein [Nitrospirae bacterium YQR-1]
MSEARQILEMVIDNFSVEKFNRFFREKSRQFKPMGDKYSYYDDDHFKDGLKLGEINFSDGDSLIIYAFEVKKELSERSGKKAQYEIAKDILKSIENQKFSAGIFIFYNSSGNFRFSLVYPESTGTSRQWSNFRRFTYFVGNELTNKTFKQQIVDGDFSSLAKIKDAFSVEKVTKEFYKSIADWYFWAVECCRFPKDAEAEENGRNIAVIRLITRMIFIWFMRERSLVPKDLFEETSINTILKNTALDESTYYTAILQNLFFATLSTKKDERQFGSEVRGYKGNNPDFGNQYVFRYQELFQNPDEINKYFGDIPFLNGGLFECLDDKKNGIIIDGFSRTKKNQPSVPNYLFFSQEQKVDLSKAYGTQNKNCKVSGLLNILSSFNFTIDENSPDDADVALDPELLGRVFENLLASFNPETSTTARKATGSYYTPREIVDYMVIESLKAYFKTHLPDIVDIDNRLEKLFSPGSHENPFNDSETRKLVELIENVKIVDPAVGSGAFPMGVLNKLVFILNKIDDGNKLWEQAQLRAADAIPDPSVKRATKTRIKEYFSGKNADYGRKLYLIQRCIYGVDIQQIAVEISKLRFFIALLVDETVDKTKDNWGIEPLPNLDFKIMQGNSLLEEYEGIKLFDEKLITGISFDKQKLIELTKQKQLLLQKKRFSCHAKNELTTSKDAEIKEELKKLEKQLNNLNKEDDKIVDSNGLFDAQNEAIQKRDELKLLHKEFFETSEKELKGKIKKQIEKIEWDLIEATLREQNKTSELIKLEQFKKSNTKPFFLWKLHFAEVFEKGGFDIVIANPPYLRIQEIQKNNPELAEKLKQIYISASGSYDIYVCFVELATGLMSKKGNIAYILPHKFFQAAFGKNLRNLLGSKKLLKKIVDFGSSQIFESATTYTCLLFLSLGNDAFKFAELKPNATVNDLNEIFDDINIHKNMHGEKVDIKILQTNSIDEDPWHFSAGNAGDVLKKLKKQTRTIADVCEKIFQGIATSADKIYFLEHISEGNGIITAFSKSLNCQIEIEKDFVKPLMKGADVHRYSKLEPKIWCIFPYKMQSGKAVLFTQDEIKMDFPLAWKYLLENKKTLESREKDRMSHEQFYAYIYPKNLTEFEKPKIVTPDIASGCQMTVDERGLYHTTTIYSFIFKKTVKESLKYFLSILNSRLFWYFLTTTGSVLRGNYFRFKTNYLMPFPIPRGLSLNEQQPFITLVDKILTLKQNDSKADTTAIEREIDQMVYKLYGLTPEEIEIVENDHT